MISLAGAAALFPLPAASQVSPNGVAVTFALPYINHAIQYVVLHRVDLANGRFAGHSVIIEAVRGIAGTAPFSREDGVEFESTKLEPGDYALVELDVNIGNERSWTCLQNMAPVYSIHDGHAVLVRTDRFQAPNQTFGSATDARVLSAAASKLDPSKTLPTEVLHPTAAIQWKKASPSFFERIIRSCGEPRTFNLVPGVGTDVAGSPSNNPESVQ
jgi:hypothetical protein